MKSITQKLLSTFYKDSRLSQHFWVLNLLHPKFTCFKITHASCYFRKVDAQTSPAEYSGYLKEYRFRLKCIYSPNPNDGAAAWTEIANIGAQPIAHNLTLSNTGPTIGDVSYSALQKIEGSLTTSLAQAIFKEWSQPTLGFLNNPFDGLGIDEYIALQNQIQGGNAPPATYTIYDGSWLKAENVNGNSNGDVSSDFPDLFYATGGDGTPVGAPYQMSVDGPISTGSIATSGFEIENISVTNQDSNQNSTAYENNTSQQYANEQSAAIDIETSGSVKGSIVPVTQKVKVESAMNSNMKNKASLSRSRDYQNTGSAGSSANFAATQNYSSSVSANLVANWKFVVQRKTRLRYRESSANIVWESSWEDMSGNE